MNGEKSSRQSKPRKSLLTLKRSPVAWARFSLKVIPSESKDVVLSKISRVVELGAKVGREIVAGSNSVVRLIENGAAAVICICRDSNHSLTDHVVEAARLRHIPIVILPKSAQELAIVLHIKRISCFAIKMQHDGEFEADKPRVARKRKPQVSEEAQDESCLEGEQKILDTITSSAAEVDSANQICLDSAVESKEAPQTEMTESEVASALIRSALIDDLRDLLISESSMKPS